jgi:hypothetical protein
MRSSLKILFISVLFLGLAKAQDANALHYLNDLRHKSGLIPFKSNHILNRAAKAHARYLIRQQINTHYEKRGRRGFVGKTPSDRVVRYGYASQDVMENVSTNTKNAKASVAYLFSAIYHRFAFLNFDKDEIGIGSADSTRKSVIIRAAVYDMGSSRLNSVCKKSFPLKNGSMYMTQVCADNQKMVPLSIYQKSKNEVRQKNAKVVYFPYDGQKDVVPAFYKEFPDPLPGYEVSGYPVSIQFNPIYYEEKKIILKTFKLYDSSGRRLKNTRVLTWKNDPNRRFKKGEFALMPLKRLEYGMTYTALFEAKIDGRKYTKKWSFTTKRFKEKLYRITKTNVTLNVKSGSTIILYFVPRSGNDLFRGYQSRGGIKVSFIDQNTLKVMLPRSISQHTSLKVNKREVRFQKK